MHWPYHVSSGLNVDKVKVFEGPHAREQALVYAQEEANSTGWSAYVHKGSPGSMVAGKAKKIKPQGAVNPAVSGEQYRLAQAVLSGRARTAHMPVSVAREIVEKTPAKLRSEYSKGNPNYGYDLDMETSMVPAWKYYDSKAARDADARLKEGDGKKVVLGYSFFGFKEGGGKKYRMRLADHRGNPKPTSQMTAGEINKALDKLDQQDSQLTREFIDAGRGNERPSETQHMNDPLAIRHRELFRRRMDLRNEMERRYGPGAPSRLPKGFGPLKNNPRQASDDMFESFHGRPVNESIDVQYSEHYHSHLASLGEMVELKVNLINGGKAVIGFEQVDDYSDTVDNPFWSSTKSTASKISASVLASLHRAAASRKERARWIPYATTDTEMRAQAKAGYLEAHDVSAKVVSRKVGRFLHKKTKYDVLVDREQLREMFRKSAADKKSSRGTREGGSKPAGAYKGYQIREVEGGFAVPKLDPTGVFSTKADAKEFIDYSKMGAKVKNPKTKLDLMLDQFVSGKREITFDTDGWKREHVDRLIAIARDRGLDAASDGRFVLVRDLRKKNSGPFSEAGKLIGKGTKAVSMPFNQALSAAGSVGGYLDSQLGRALRRNPTDHSGPVLLASNEDGTQLFIVGGDQSLDLPGLNITGPESSKELVTIGDATHIVYHTRKIFDGKEEEFDYIHKFSEDSNGPLPVLIYDRINQQLKLSGGMYKIERPLVGTSVGIED